MPTQTLTINTDDGLTTIAIEPSKFGTPALVGRYVCKEWGGKPRPVAFALPLEHVTFGTLVSLGISPTHVADVLDLIGE